MEFESQVDFVLAILNTTLILHQRVAHLSQADQLAVIQLILCS